jgi:glycosyltransferase involved in cell wall biosynthesis
VPPEVSVVIPTHARAAAIERAVRCALGQTGVDLEVVVVVDGVVDDTADLVAAIGDPRVRTLVLEDNQGVATARNRGAALATARWLSFLDDDDSWAPQRTRALLDAAGDAGIVTAGTISVEPGGRILYRGMPGTDLRSANVIGGPSSAIVRRDAFNAAGGFDPAFAVLADWDLWLRVARDHPIAVAPGVLHGYVVHPASMHVRRTAAAEEEFARLRARHGPLDEVVHLRWLADAQRRAGARGSAVRTALRALAAGRTWADARRVVGIATGVRGRGPGGPPPEWLAR